MRRVVAVVLFAGLIGSAAAQDAEKELKKLEGSYQVKGLKKDGTDAPKEVMDSVKGVEIRGDKLIIKVMGEDKTAKIKVDPTKKPAQIDITPEDKPEENKTLPGIYSLEKGELTIVFAEGGDRPKDFKADGEKTLKMVLTRKGQDDK
jgi:uncharacterized protein (TIGR03067 family)